MFDHYELQRRAEAFAAGYWEIPGNLDVSGFNFGWRPDPHDRPYVHQFGTQWQKTGGPRFIVPGAEGIKYRSEQKAVHLPNKENFKVNVDCQVEFDWSWHPDDTEPAFIWIFGNQYVDGREVPTVEYAVDGATAIKYVDDVKARLISDRSDWIVNHPVELDNFDFSWYPDPREPKYIYVWGNQYCPGEVMPTIEYRMPGATQYKYVNDSTARLKIDHDNWVIHRDGVFDVLFNPFWTPPPSDPPYIYVWGNKCIPATVKPTLEYRVPGATEYKYMDNSIELMPKNRNWKILKPINYFDFDFSWEPDPYDPPYIYAWGNEYLPPEEMPTVEYHAQCATDYKYMHNVRAKLANNPECWVKHDLIDETKFDFSWTPHPYDPPYIYVWGNKWVSGEVKATVEYHTPGATDYKYMPDPVEVLPQWECWVEISPINKENFDFTWRPSPLDPPFIYVWGNKWVPAEIKATLEYHVPGATERKYMADPVDSLPDWSRWKIYDSVCKESFDFTWQPDPFDPPFIYVWGNKWVPGEVQATLEYHTPGATDKKYILDPVELNQDDPKNNPSWKILIEGATIDFSWRHDPTSPPYIYVWGNKWNDAATEPTILYEVEGATEYKYMDDMVAELPPSTAGWKVGSAEHWNTFDFSWRPNPHSPPMTYQWENDGPIYSMPGAVDVVLMQWSDQFTAKEVKQYYIEGSLEELIDEHPDEVFWALNPDINYEKFDFDWRPTKENFKHINVFGNEYSKDTQTYFVNAPVYKMGYAEFNYIEDVYLQMETKLSMFWVDTGVSSPGEFDRLKEKYPQLQRTRFVNRWVDTINRCAKKTETKLFWVLSSEYDYTDFDFTYYPSKWQYGMLHVFGTQWNHWGNTYLVNSKTFEEDTKYVNVIEHLKNINHVRGTKAKIKICKHDILYIDHGNTNSANDAVFQKLDRKVYVAKYRDSYLITLKDWIIENQDLLQGKQKYIWITSSVCDYSKFDFSWYMDPFQAEQLHVFSSSWDRIKQKFGDTFLLDVTKFMDSIAGLERLDEYRAKVNFIEYISADRLPHPVLEHTMDSQVDAIKSINNIDFPYIEIIDGASTHKTAKVPPLNLWDESKKTIIIGSNGASQIVVPSAALGKVKREVYDYPWIDKIGQLGQSKLLDIVFISNGEPVADDNYNHLAEMLKRKKIPNRLVRVKDVNGRVASQHAAANSSDTNWYFLVNGKVRVSEDFDWGWQPDRLQEAKHYIFNVLNPVNGLRYGHQAIVANNKRLTLATTTRGLDFTLDSPHEVVDMDCGIALYNTDPWTTWRTAFRESIKLRCNGDSDSKMRLEAWLSPGSGDNAEWSQRGARDGVEYWESVEGNLSKLLLSYDWDWIQSYYGSKYGNEGE